MALNFPADTSQPYVDQTTGLKYVFNTSVGAWESAIQPPAIVYDYPPNIRIPGFLYWDKQDGNLYIFYRDDNGDEQWVEAVPSASDTGNSSGAFPPPNPKIGDLWFDTEIGRLYTWYNDGGSEQWVDCTGANGGGGSKVEVGPTPPLFPDVGNLWFNTTDGRLYVWYEDSNSSQWVDVTGTDIIPSPGINTLVSPDRSIEIFQTNNQASIQVSINSLPGLP